MRADSRSSLYGDASTVLDPGQRIPLKMELENVSSSDVQVMLGAATQRGGGRPQRMGHGDTA